MNEGVGTADTRLRSCKAEDGLTAKAQTLAAVVEALFEAFFTARVFPRTAEAPG
jgi:hypothetical protein